MTVLCQQVQVSNNISLILQSAQTNKVGKS